MSLHHTNDADLCPMCEEKLRSACPVMVAWFRWLRTNRKDAHVSWAFRDEEDQDRMYNQHLTMRKWPDSRHNVVDEQGNPSSEALDLFRLVNGMAEFHVDWYTEISNDSKAAGLAVEWAGDWQHFKEFDHFQKEKV